MPSDDMGWRWSTPIPAMMQALSEFATLLKENPEYTAGYFMAAQTLAKMGKTVEARDMLTRGIDTAERTNNAHAKSEMEGMLAELG